ncbi:MAG: hypothetical protein R3B13_25180 [Polyangiaceae bacterium]
MRGSINVTLLLVLLSAPCLASSRVKEPYANRGQTLPKHTLRIDDGVYWPLPRGMFELTSIKVGGERDSDARFNAGAGFGLLEDLELGVHLIKYGNSKLDPPAFYGLYRFLPKDVELSAYAELTPRVGHDPTLTVGVPASFHLGESVRIDTGPFVLFPFETNVDAVFIAPLQIPINVSREFFLGPEAALTWIEFDQDVYSAGLFVGYTIPGDAGPFGDVGARFRLPNVDVGFDAVQVLAEFQMFWDF